MSAARSREPSSSDSTPHVSARGLNESNLLDFVNNEELQSAGISGESDQKGHNQLENSNERPFEEIDPRGSSYEFPVRVDLVSLLSLTSSDSRNAESNISDRTGDQPAKSEIVEAQQHGSSSESTSIPGHIADQASRDVQPTKRTENQSSMQISIHSELIHHKINNFYQTFI